MAKSKVKEKFEETKNAHECDCKDENGVDTGCNCGDDCDCKQESTKPENEYLELARRVQAEFDNYRKRNEQIIVQTKDMGVLKAVEEFLPVLDSMVLALEQIQDESAKKGFVMIENQLQTALKNLKVEKIEAVGVEFDPNLHNAIMVEENENQPENTILQEFQAGYKIGNKVIRHSVVKINK